MLIPIKDRNPTTTHAYVTLSIMAINLAVFVYEIALGANTPAQNQFILTYSFIPRDLVHGGVLGNRALMTLFTSMFLHAGLLHIGGNMLYLWIFGNNVEDRIGHLPFLLFYLLSGLGAAVAQTMSGPNSPIPNLGASGAIAGVLGAYLILFPRTSILTLVPIFLFFAAELPAIVVIGFWFVLQLLNSWASITSQGPSVGIAYVAHVGGFLTGLILIFFMPKKRRPRRPAYPA